MLTRDAAALVAGAVLLAGGLAGCGSFQAGVRQGRSGAPSSTVAPSASIAPSPTGGGVPLVLRASGTSGLFDVSWFADDGSTSRAQNGVTGPWERTVYSADPRAVNMGVQAESGAGTVSCSILRDGRVVASDQQPGADGANCNYPAGG